MRAIFCEGNVQASLRTIRQTALASALVIAVAGYLATRRAAAPTPDSADDLRQSLAQLSAELRQLRLEREMPARVVNRSSGSICYIYATYSFDHPGMRVARPVKIHVSGTGFVVADGWIATNRHVAEPWWGDPHLRSPHRPLNARPDKVLAFFPGLAAPLELTRIMHSPDADLAIAHFDPEAARKAARAPADAPPRPLPLAALDPQPGDAVLVLGYPMGVEGMLAKSPRAAVRKLSLEQDDFYTARGLASMSLIRPSATQGHLGDVVADKLLYDASTAQGASGSPVFNARGEVIGVNTAYLDGFSGGGLGVSIRKLPPLLRRAQVALAAAKN